MDTRGKSNAEFRAEVNDTLTRHETSIHQVNNHFEHVNTTLQTVLSELHSLRVSNQTPRQPSEVNPFFQGESSRAGSEPNHSQLKLNFPRFDGDDSHGWIYKAEQYFDFKSVPPDQKVSLTSFHLEGLALQWHQWFMKFRGPVSWSDFTKAIYSYTSVPRILRILPKLCLDLSKLLRWRPTKKILKNYPIGWMVYQNPSWSGVSQLGCETIYDLM